ncbi:hypothetical protein [Actinacidiphila acidipaludis]|uniref:Uncharacterized protein n=1 Tax=Actinacidiphila acidipaludis TaxID=2873382 RepID=A0ABS7PZ38_9ACTN|nr:hypothetical protein [Streptomyces acidipaludis]MBY8876155.1 hypothetical protein [Streptomyces acidipaludis]
MPHLGERLLADRVRLTPGEVRYDRFSDSGRESEVTVPVAEFRAEACKDR